MEDTQKAGARDSAKARTYEGFSGDERDAMKARAQELKAAGRRGSRAAQKDGEGEVLAKIAEMTDADRALAERIHAIVKAAVPDVEVTTWYGMPAYAKGGKVICFFQTAQKFKSRYATLGFSDKANLDDGNMWPVYYALTTLTDADEARIGALVKQAAS